MSVQRRHGEVALTVECEAGVQRHFPDMAVGVTEGSGVTPVERVARASCDGGARRCRSADHLVDLSARPDVVGKGDPTEGGSIVGDTGVCGQVVAAPEDDRLSASLKEDGLFDFLPAPSELLVEGASAGRP